MRFLITLFIVFYPITVHAQESLRFREAKGFKEQQIISEFLDGALIAPVDLNDDLIDEYIILNQSDNSKLKQYSIVALNNRKPIIIGSFNAQKLLVDGKKSYGVRQLIIYNHPYNDFKRKIAAWDPYKFSYVLQ